jgi:hypothetical protein
MHYEIQKTILLILKIVFVLILLPLVFFTFVVTATALGIKYVNWFTYEEIMFYKYYLTSLVFLFSVIFINLKRR